MGSLNIFRQKTSIVVSKHFECRNFISQILVRNFEKTKDVDPHKKSEAQLESSVESDKMVCNEMPNWVELINVPTMMMKFPKLDRVVASTMMIL